MRSALLLSIVTSFCVVLGVARAQESQGPAQPHGHPAEHAPLHDEFYSKLQVPDAPPGASLWQKSCCNNRDCRPVQARFNGSEWEFLSPSGWRRVPPEKMLDVKSPDARAHACVSLATDKLRCFVKPGFGT